MSSASVQRWLWCFNPKNCCLLFKVSSLSTHLWKKMRATWINLSRWNQRRLSLWDDFRCCSSNTALHMSGLDLQLNEEMVASDNSREVSAFFWHLIGMEWPKKRVICTGVQQSSCRVPQKLLQTNVLCVLAENYINYMEVFYWCLCCQQWSCVQLCTHWFLPENYLIKTSSREKRERVLPRRTTICRD